MTQNAYVAGPDLEHHLADETFLSNEPDLMAIASRHLVRAVDAFMPRFATADIGDSSGLGAPACLRVWGLTDTALLCASIGYVYDDGVRIASGEATLQVLPPYYVEMLASPASIDGAGAITVWLGGVPQPWRIPVSIASRLQPVLAAPVVSIQSPIRTN